MESFQRRPVDRTPPRRPIISAPPGRPVHVSQPQQASALRPPTVGGSVSSMDMRPAAAAPSSAFRSPAPAGQPQQQPARPPQPLTSTAPQAPVKPETHQHAPVHIATEPSKAPKGPHPTGHAGLVGFIVFVVLAALCFAPLLPGKIWQTAPGSSQSFSTGDQNLDCLETLGKTTTKVVYNTKLGFPLVYDYSTTSTLSANCGSQVQHATGGHTSQFNPLGALIDAAAALAVAIIVAKLWRRFRGAD